MSRIAKKNRGVPSIKTQQGPVVEIDYKKMSTYFGTKPEWIINKLDGDRVVAEDSIGLYVTNLSYVNSNLLDPHRMYKRVVPTENEMPKKEINLNAVTQSNDAINCITEEKKEIDVSSVTQNSDALILLEPSAYNK